MIIDIPDNITGKRRRKLLRVLPIEYALEKFDYHRVKTATFLGISPRTLRKLFHDIPELRKYKKKPQYVRGIMVNYLKSIINQCDTIDDFLDIVKSKPAYTTLKTQKEKILYIKQMVNKYEEIKNQ